MSNHLISEVYKRQVGNVTRTAVMLLMADKASDDGSGVWSSKQRMADELGMSRRGVIKVVASLIEDGLIQETGQRECANGFTIEYAIAVQRLRALPLVPTHLPRPLDVCTSEPRSQVNDIPSTREHGSPDPCTSFTPPVNTVHPKHPRTLLEPSLNQNDMCVRKGRRGKSGSVSKPDDVSDQVWEDFVAHRRRRRADLTSTALDGIRSQAVAAGWTLEAALVEMVARGWTGFKAEWVRESNSGGKRSDRPGVAQIGLAVAQRRRAARVGRDQQTPLLESHHDNGGTDLTAGMAAIIGSSVR